MKKNSLSHIMRIRKQTSKSVLNRTSMSLNSYVHISPLTPWVPWGQSSYTLPHLLKDENLEQGNLLWSLACISIIFLLSFPRIWLQNSWQFYMSFDARKYLENYMYCPAFWTVFHRGKMFSVFCTIIPDWNFTHSCWVLRDNSTTWLI